jgi:ADP-ribosylglycohydrolase
MVKTSTTEPYGSYGNGSAMRVSAVGFYYDTVDEVLEKAKQSAEVKCLTKINVIL